MGGSPPLPFLWSWSMTETKLISVFFLNFQKWCYESSLYTENKKSKLIDILFNFTSSFIPPCDNQVSDVDDSFWFHQHAPCCCGEFFYQIIRTVHYNLIVPLCAQSMFHLHSHTVGKPVVSKFFVCNPMPCSGYSALHGVNANWKKTS